MNFSKANMYADDTNSTIASSATTELTRMTKKEVLNFRDWLRVNKPSANPQKQSLWLLVKRRINEINDLLCSNLLIV